MYYLAHVLKDVNHGLLFSYFLVKVYCCEIKSTGWSVTVLVSTGLLVEKSGYKWGLIFSILGPFIFQKVLCLHASFVYKW